MALTSKGLKDEGRKPGDGRTLGQIREDLYQRARLAPTQPTDADIDALAALLRPRMATLVRDADLGASTVVSAEYAYIDRFEVSETADGVTVTPVERRYRHGATMPKAKRQADQMGAKAMVLDAAAESVARLLLRDKDWLASMRADAISAWAGTKLIDELDSRDHPPECAYAREADDEGLDDALVDVRLCDCPVRTEVEAYVRSIMPQ